MRTYLLIIIIFSLIGTSAHSATFSTGFESENATTLQTVSITNNGLTLTLTGGTAFRIGNGSLYHAGLKSWMLDPAGTTARGTSTGIGTITFSENAMSVDFYIRTSNASSTAQIVIMDSTGAVLVDQSDIGHLSWTRIQHEVVSGAALISEITVAALGTDMLAIDTFSFTTETTDGSSTDENTETGTPPDGVDIYGDNDDSDDSGSGSLAWVLITAALSLLRRSRFLA